MPRLYEFDKTKAFNRGRELANLRIDGTPARIGHYKGMIVRESCYYTDRGEFHHVTPAQYGVKAFMFSTHYQRQGWETDLFCSKEHAREVFGSEFHAYPFNTQSD